MKIEGKVATIIYRNEVNGWTVLLLNVDNEYITATGETESIEVDDKLELEGEFVSHKVYGEQFKFDTLIKVMPKTAGALIEYIASNVKGIGKKTAERIIQTFGDDTIDIIRFHKDRLNDIKGLNEEKIIALFEFFNDEWDKWNVIEFLSKFHISVLKANKIYKSLGTDTIDIVKENPYSLLSFSAGIDFNVVDDIAKSQGVALNDDSRLSLGVLYVLAKITEFGHTCVLYNELVQTSVRLLEVSVDDITNTITKLTLKDKVFIEEIDEKEYVFRRSFYIAERNIASFVVSHSMEKSLNKTYKSEIKKISKKDSTDFSDEQIDAILQALNNKISIITGGPGTGKTTIIKGIIEILEDMHKDYVLCAPTGRAAKRITETTKREAKTLHRLLEITKVNDNDIDSFLDLEIREVDTDYIIVDEASMLDIIMMNNLIRATGNNTSIIFVGDVNQLPSVGPGNILKDIIDSNVVTTVKLEHVYRQSNESQIVLNAHKVNRGEHLEFKNTDTDCFFVKTNSTEDTLNNIKSLISHRLSNYDGIDISKEIQVLTPMKKTELGTVELNKEIQSIVNPKSEIKKEKKFGDKTFRIGDKVMQIVNDYDKRSTIDGKAVDGVYNGDIGYIVDIDFNAQNVLIKFDEDKVIAYEFDEMDEIEHAYAVTIHKSQGSEFDYVILPLYIGYKKLFTRNLLYTAITRAKKMLIIVGSSKIINFMIDNIDEKKRKTGLKKKILDLL